MAAEDLQQLRELVEFLKANGIAEFDMERTDLKVRLKFAGLQPAPPAVDLSHLASAIAAQSAAAPAVAAAPVAIPATLPGATPVAAAAAPVPEAGPEAGAHIVKSPIVGTFYGSPSPGAASFVSPGDRVDKGQVICIVEAMKLMNEIEADAAGQIVKCLVTNGQPIEFGQPLFSIRVS